jgi:hypothetical protein
MLGFLIETISKALAIVFVMGFFVGFIGSDPNASSICHWPTTVQKYTPGFLMGCKLGDIINKEKQ